MVIKILKSQIQPNRRSPNTGGISVDTGASQFFNSVAQFGNNARAAVMQYGTAVAQQELKLKAQTYDTQIEQNFNSIQKTILDPAGEYATRPDLWEGTYNELAAGTLEELIATTDNKTLQTSILASWNTNKVKYEKDIIKGAASRTSNLLQQSYLSKFETAKNELINVTDGDALTIIADNFTQLVDEYAAMGFMKADETITGYYEDYIGEAIRVRVKNAAADMSMSSFLEAYETGSLGEGDPITTMLMGMLQPDDIEKILDAAFDAKSERLKFINDATDRMEVKYQDDLTTAIIEMDGEADPNIKQARHINLKVKYAHDDEAMQKIKTAYETDHAISNDPTLNISIVKKDIAFGLVSIDDLDADYKPRLDQTTYKELVDLIDQNRKPSSPLVTNLTKRLVESVYGSEAGFIKLIREDDPSLAAIMEDGMAIYVEKFRDGLENLPSDKSEIELFDEITEQAKTLIKTRKAATVKIELNDLSNKYPEVKFVYEDINATIQNVRDSSILESKKRMIIGNLKTMQEIYGLDIFKLASELD